MFQKSKMFFLATHFQHFLVSGQETYFITFMIFKLFKTFIPGFCPVENMISLKLQASETFSGHPELVFILSSYWAECETNVFIFCQINCLLKFQIYQTISNKIFQTFPFIWLQCRLAQRKFPQSRMRDCTLRKWKESMKDFY